MLKKQDEMERHHFSVSQVNGQLVISLLLYSSTVYTPR